MAQVAQLRQEVEHVHENLAAEKRAHEDTQTEASCDSYSRVTNCCVLNVWANEDELLIRYFVKNDTQLFCLVKFFKLQYKIANERNMKTT